MNRHEALIEAQRRWGPFAMVSETEATDYAGTHLVRSVGMMLQSMGRGPTWEDAFLDAAKRERGPENNEVASRQTGASQPDVPGPQNRSGSKTADAIRATSSAGGAVEP